MLPLAALVGGIIGGPLLEVLGRKTTIMSTAIPFMGAGKFKKKVRLCPDLNTRHMSYQK